jgi:hypothetical protein
MCPLVDAIRGTGAGLRVEVVMQNAAVYAKHAMGCETAANPSAVSRVERWTYLKATTDVPKVKIL